MAYGEDDRYLFEIRLTIKHPSIDPAVITKELGREPNYTWQVGSPRKFLNGKPRPGVYEDSMWNHNVVVEGRRHFFKEIEKCIAGFELHADFLRKIVDGSGRIVLTAKLPGETNIGDVMRWESLTRLGALKINLGTEVFPNLKKR